MNPQKNGVTKGLFYPAAVAFIPFLATGCISVNYKPVVSLGMCPKTIKANVRLDTFIDECPKSDKKVIGFVGVTVQGELAPDVTDAVLTDFSNNPVFETVKKQFSNEPDLVIKGTIHRFYGTAMPAGVGWLIIPPLELVWLTGLPFAEDYGRVDLEMSLERPDGTVLGTYYGRSEFSKFRNWYQSLGESGALHLLTQTDKAFSEAVAQIREQILRDEVKLSRQR